YVAYRTLPFGLHHFLTVTAASVAGVGWRGAGVVVLAKGRGGRMASSTLTSAPYLVLGLASVAGVAAVYSPVPFSLDAAALAMSAGLLLAGGAAYGLLATLSEQGASTLRLRTMIRSLERYQAREEERTHDARSALLAVQTAVTALTRYRERLDDQARTSLEVAVDAEMVRLVGLMGRTSPGDAGAVRCTDFEVVGPVASVVTAALAFGDRVKLRVPDTGCSAFGRPDDVARVVETLLDNARRYASTSPVSVSVVQREGAVAVVVEDRGPGVRADERELVFTRGGRGSASAGVPGSGLGLFSARRLMEDQGGSLVLRADVDGAPVGAVFIALLPASAPDQQVVKEIADHVVSAGAADAMERVPVPGRAAGLVRALAAATGASSARGSGPFEAA
ncbi:MAG: sensor histidine kinase, partial [Acidimicrobiales bacterium]